MESITAIKHEEHIFFTYNVFARRIEQLVQMDTVQLSNTAFASWLNQYQKALTMVTEINESVKGEWF